LIVAGGGSGSDFNYLEDLKEDKPYGVRFVGFLTGDELYVLYAYARVFVFPSEYEAMSMALLEGLSFGVPTIYSDIPANNAVANGLGFSFSVSSSESMAEQLTFVLDNYDKAEERSRKATDVIKNKHTWGSIAKQYNDIYFQLSAAK
jgi:glycosyltransferase involved in cell wall biosynthesis